MKTRNFCFVLVFALITFLSSNFHSWAKVSSELPPQKSSQVNLPTKLNPATASKEQPSNSSEKKPIKATVLKILFDKHSPMHDGQKQREQLLQLKLADGRTIETINNVPPTLSYQVVLKEGDQILVTEDDGAFFVEGYFREKISWMLLALFVGLILWVGGKKGILAFVSLILKISILLLAFIPAIKAGVSPILAASIFCILSTFLTISLVSGWNYKTLSACLGTIAGVLVAGALGIWAVKSARLTGLLEPEMESLHYQFALIKIPEMIAAGVLIGSLGASMDVGISVASAMYEVHFAAPGKKMLELFRIGMNVGQDIMGTMINTLILAYAGSSLATIILITQIDPNYVMNMELVVKELIISVVGSIGLILTIPLTALLCSYLYPKIISSQEKQFIS
jgi:uncharacterized membrane protein